jgi:hypothetical protein
LVAEFDKLGDALAACQLGRRLRSGMADDGVRYETRTVRAIRGLEARTVSKWERQGWEAVAQSPGRLQTEITIRRPRPKVPWRLFAIGGGGIAVLIIAAIVTGIIREGDSAETPTGVRSDAGSTAGQTTSQEPTATKTAEPEEAAITAEKNTEFAAVLGLGDNCDSSIAAFAKKYHGQTVAFDGHVGAMNNHGSYATRYDILLGAGDYSTTSAHGPAFQFRDVNTISDLRYTGEVQGTIGVGTNLHITAQVDEYEPTSCLFLLKPVETAFR